MSRAIPAKLVLAALFVFALGTPVARADFQAVDFTSVTTDFTNNTWSLGWQFHVNQTVNVTALGFYDDLKNGLTQSHDVGIYDMSGNLLASTTVVPGDSLIGWFRYHGISPLTLSAGQDYRIAAETGSEKYTFATNGFVTDPRITYTQSQFIQSPSLGFPTQTDTLQGYFGPNFLIGAAPEPGSLTLAGMGALSLLGYGWRRFRLRIA